MLAGEKMLSETPTWFVAPGVSLPPEGLPEPGFPPGLPETAVGESPPPPQATAAATRIAVVILRRAFMSTRSELAEYPTPESGGRRLSSLRSKFLAFATPLRRSFIDL